MKLIFIIFLILPFRGIASNGNYYDPSEYSSLDGVPNVDIPAENFVSIDGACIDDALDLIGCSSYNALGVSIDDVTVLVIDMGITAYFWETAETNDWFDIIQYRVTNEDPNIVDDVRGSVGSEPWSTEPWSNLNDNDLAHRSSQDHGINILSALSTVARGIKIVFVTSPTLKNGNINHVWKAVDNAINTPGIDVDIISFSGSDYTSDNTYFDDWYNSGIFMLTSAGNFGTNDNYGNFDPDDDPDEYHYYKYPQFESQWFSIGSVDHEDRTPNPTQPHPDPGSSTGSVSPFSSWGDTVSVNSANSVDFVMPGNGVPVHAFQYGSTPDEYFWAYDIGTSISVPYMAGAVAILLDSYMDGRVWNGGDRAKPSIQTIYSILKEASSGQDYYDYKFGWGYIYLMDLWLFAHRGGQNSLPPYDADMDDLPALFELEIGTNPSIFDTDHDGISDKYDDHDGDGISNWDEYLESSSDTDEDGLTDGIEIMILSTDPYDNDSDNDGILDGNEDTDGDGLSNIQEVITYGTNPLVYDMDGDGLNDYQEVITYSSDPWDTDSDSDGLNDYQEAIIYGTDPNNVDSDGDTLPDVWEVQYMPSLNPIVDDRIGDPDGDDLSNEGEYDAGTDPTDPDTDNDGVWDFLELYYGTDPLLDDIAPDLTITVTYTGNYGTFVRDNAYISASASDPNMYSVEFYVETGLYYTDVTPAYGYVLDTNTLTSGQFYIIYVRAYDTYGNEAVSSFTINVDNVAPNGYAYLYGSPSNYVSGTGRDFYTAGLIDVGGSGIDAVGFYIDGVYYSLDTTNSYRLYNLPSTSYSDGSHQITARVYDNVGNYRDTSTSFTIDNDNPWAGVSGISNGASYSDGTTRTISVTGYDIGTGINRIDIYAGSSLIKRSYSSSTSVSYTFNDPVEEIVIKVYDNAGHSRTYTYWIYTTGGGGPILDP